MSARRRWCVARHGCIEVAVTTIPAPRGTVGRISACRRCADLAGVQVPAEVVEAVASKRAPKRSTWTPPAPVLAVAAEGTSRQRRPSVDSLLSQTTRALLWLDEQPGGVLDRRAMCAALGRTALQTAEAALYMRRRGWLYRDVAGRDVMTPGGHEEARLRRDELDALTPEQRAQEPRVRTGKRDESKARYSSGRPVCPSHLRESDAARRRMDDAMLKQIQTRVLWWLAEPGHGGTGYMEQAAADLGLSTTQVRAVNKAIVARGWAMLGRLTPAGKVEVQRRRDVQARRAAEVQAEVGWAVKAGGVP